MPQGIKGWALWGAVQIALTFALKLLIKLMDNAVMGWGRSDRLAEFLGITSPTGIDGGCAWARASIRNSGCR